MLDVADLPTDFEWLEDVSLDAGLDFVHFNGMTGENYFPEIMGSGAALLDYDDDGDLDLYLVQGAMLDPELGVAEAVPPYDGPPGDRLYRNDLVVEGDGTRRVAFTDVTVEAGIDALGYGMGVTTGDFDDDGFVDLYVTNFGSNQLWRNNGDGTFSDVTVDAGADDPRWSTAAAFVDIDSDGLLDLYVCNYVDFRLTNHKECINVTGASDYCAPGTYSPVPDRVLRNQGDGTFEDVSLSSRIAIAKGAGLGVLPADFDLDGDVDIYVANDQMANHYWSNQGDGTFRNDALIAGVAVNATGSPEASMGLDAGDFDADADLDMFITHLRGETNTLYVNDGSGMFTDRTVESGLAPDSKPRTGFGTSWFDLNNDGWLDLLIANGAVTALEGARDGDVYHPYREHNQLFLNLGNGRFVEVGAKAGAVFALSEVSRGATFGDLDNDGDVDVVFSNNSGPARVLINRLGDRAHWIGLRLRRGDARVGVSVPGRPTVWRWASRTGSYCSANDPRVIVGLGDATAVERVRVEWLNGGVEEWSDVPLDHWTDLTRGGGTAVK